MSTSDGYIAGRHKIVDHGPNAQRFNITILGDGYRASELAQYATDVQSFVDRLRSTAPFNDLFCGINVHRIDVVSTDSGADDPGTCTDGSSGSGATPNTYFDSTFCSDGDIRRALSCDKSSARSTALAQVPETHMTMVIVNTSEYGGTGGSVAIFSTAPSAAEIGLHEMGHTAFGFADEYEYYAGCASGESGHDDFGGGEPSEPNVTANTNRATIKWAAQLTNSDALPTTANGDCASCDTQSNPKAASYVGAYEGARYFHCGCYRPSFNCRMRALNNAFCAVCQAVIRATMQPFLPAESLTLTTPSISFLNIPAGLGGVGVTAYRAIVFDVVTCGTRTFRITSGPTGGFGTPLGTVAPVSAADDSDPVAHARLWLSYTSTTAGASSSGTVTVRCDETGETWVISITANTVARPKSAVALVLDHSGSMSEDAGGGTSKVAKLREACSVFVNAMLPGDGISVVRFDDTAQVLMPVTDAGPPVLGAGRIAAIGHVSGPELDPAGNTSIGAGVVAGKGALDAAQALGTPRYDVTAILALTDGVENTAPMLASVGSSITANTFAVGLGTPENISTAALNTLTSGHNGYLLVTGALTSDQAARLNKYFLQILAGITNANVVLDPHGVLVPGAIHRIPFDIAEPDYGMDVFLLCPSPSLVDFELEAPNGERITTASPGTLPNIQYVQAGQMGYYRLSLPADPAVANGTHAGRWNAVLRLGRGRTQYLDQQNYAVGAAGVGQLPYDVIVHCYSSLTFKAYAHQSSFEPGALVQLTATLHEYDVPIDHRARVWAEVTRPDRSTFTLSLGEDEPGRFSAAFTAGLVGLYTMRVRAIGSTFLGTSFQREQTLSAAAYPGGDRPPQTGGGQPSWCELLECLAKTKSPSGALIEQWQSHGVDVAALLACLTKDCRPGKVLG